MKWALTQEITQMLQEIFVEVQETWVESRKRGLVSRKQKQIQEMTSECTILAKNISIYLKMSPGNQLLFQGIGQLVPGNVLGGPENDVTEYIQVLYYSGGCTSSALNTKRG